jgi:ribosomal protein L7/L12
MNNYAAAIQVLSDPSTDFRTLAFEVAKTHPKALADAAARLKQGFGWQEECKSLKESGRRIEAIKQGFGSWQEECKSLKESGRRIEAIKYYRNSTGSTLKAAMEAVDTL